jgi:hypothetical protein
MTRRALVAIYLFGSGERLGAWFHRIDPVYSFQGNFAVGGSRGSSGLLRRLERWSGNAVEHQGRQDQKRLQHGSLLSGK